MNLILFEVNNFLFNVSFLYLEKLSSSPLASILPDHIMLGDNYKL